MPDLDATTIISEELMIYLGSFIFAAMAILLVVVFVKKFRQSND